MKILLLGANGQVGHALRSHLPALGTLVASTRHGRDSDLACDLADTQAVRDLLTGQSPQMVVNAAAYTAVDRAETDREAAYALNATLPGLLGAWAKQNDASVIHYSTDYVFDGTATRPYREDDPTHPLGAYGQGKLSGEQALAASGCRHLILRTAWVYGAHGHNFLKTMLRLASERDGLDVVDDQWGTPTSAPWIAAATAFVMTRWPASEQGGIVNLTANGRTTWRGFAAEIVAGAHQRGLLKNRPEVRPMATADYPTPARRPAFSVLDGNLAQGRFGLERPEWPNLVHEILDRMASHT